MRLTISTLIPWAFLAAGFFPLVVIGYLGTFTRYLADDYSTSRIALSMGLWKAQVYWYQVWQGRFSYTLFVSAAELVGVRIVAWLPVTGLLLWSSFLYWTIKQLLKTLGLEINNIWAGILASLIIFGTIKSFREYSQVIYWQTGLINYQTSMLFISLMVGVFLKRFYLSEFRKLAFWEYAAWFLAFFIAGGLSDTWAILQISIAGMLILTYALMKKSPIRMDVMRLMTLGFLTSWAAFLVILKSPGNLNRSTTMGSLSASLIFHAVINAFWDVPRYLFGWASGNTMLVLMLFLAGLAAGLSKIQTEKKRNLLWPGLFLILGTTILLWAGFIPYFTVMGIRPVDRVLIMPMFMFIWAFVLLGVFFGLQLKSRLSPLPGSLTTASILAILAFFLFWIPIRTAISYARIVPDLRLYAQLWDKRDLELRQASALGEQDVIVNSLKHDPALHNIQDSFWIEADLQDATDNWINEAAAAYYGLRSITLRR